MAKKSQLFHDYMDMYRARENRPLSIDFVSLDTLFQLVHTVASMAAVIVDLERKIERLEAERD